MGTKWHEEKTTAMRRLDMTQHSALQLPSCRQVDKYLFGRSSSDQPSAVFFVFLRALRIFVMRSTH
ncbi:MAG TPA: hypothetical protein VF523_05225, partial [Burkholderiales bacterium]